MEIKDFIGFLARSEILSDIFRYCGCGVIFAQVNDQVFLPYATFMFFQNMNVSPPNICLLKIKGRVVQNSCMCAASANAVTHAVVFGRVWIA
jgi:hypothetical protein